MFKEIRTKDGLLLNQYEVISDKSDVVPNAGIDLGECIRQSIAPPESGDVSYMSDDGEVSFDDAHPYISDKIEALEALQGYENAYKQAKSDAERKAAETAANALAGAVDNKPVNTGTEASESAGNI